MRKRANENIVKLLLDFQKSLNQIPDYKKMVEEIRMMKFKIRPIEGNLSEVDFNNKKFVEILWKLGKLDSFFQEKILSLKGKEKEFFLNFFESVYSKYQEDLNKIKLSKNKFKKTDNFLAVEIFKETSDKVN